MEENRKDDVTTCKNCKWKCSFYESEYGNTICGVSGMYVVNEDDFCSYGERKGSTLKNALDKAEKDINQWIREG